MRLFGVFKTLDPKLHVVIAKPQWAGLPACLTQNTRPKNSIHNFIITNSKATRTYQSFNFCYCLVKNTCHPHQLLLLPGKKYPGLSEKVSASTEPPPHTLLEKRMCRTVPVRPK